MTDLSLLVVVLDRSGSMTSIKNDMEEGLNGFLAAQKKEPGDCRLTFAQFDTEYEVLADYIDLKDAPYFTLTPRGSTALYDAIGQTLATVDEGLRKATPKPENIIVCIVTDGQENASKEWTSEKVKELIESRPYNWKFTYLGANQTAILEASRMGITAATSLTYTPTSAGIRASYGSLSTSVSHTRSTGAAYSFTTTDRTQAMSRKKP